MLILNELVGFGAADGGNQTTCTFLQLARDDSDLTTYTYAAQNFGTADARRYIIAAIGGRASVARTLNGVTIGGVTATQIANVTVGTTGIAALFAAAVPTGTSGDVVLTFSGGMLRTGCALFSLLSDFDATVPTDAQTDNTLSGNDLSVSLSVPVGGVVIACNHMNSTSAATSWTGVAEDYDQVTAENSAQGYSGGRASYTTSPLTVTCTITTGPTTCALAAASFR